MNDFAATGYIVSSILYLFFLALLLISWRGKVKGGFLILAAFFSLLWSVGHAYQYISVQLPGWVIYLVEALRNTGWLLFIVGLLNFRESKIIPDSIKYGIYVFCLMAILSGLYVEVQYESYTLHSPSNQVSIVFLLLLVLCGLVLIEQLYRNSPAKTARSMKYMTIGLGGIFAYDIFILSTIFILKEVDTYVWVLRSILNAIIVPVLAIYARRNPELSIEIFVSRHVVFYTTSLIVTGIYLLGVALGGYYIQVYGGEWSSVFQTLFFILSAIMLIFILTSSASRAKLKVFISKHFYQNKYDYREEWMRLNAILSEQKDIEKVRMQVMVALMDILDSKGSQLWLKQDTDSYICVDSIGMPVSGESIEDKDDLVLFLRQRNWVIDMDEYMVTPDLYGDLELPASLSNIKNIWLIIPLKHHENLLGFVIMDYPRISRKINWEDRDLLKVVTDQVASYLAVVTMIEELDQAQQFEAFNRLSAYVVHDLKNLVAQLGLIVTNASKHKNNPEFLDDVVATIENAVKKMHRLLEQLRKDRFDKADSNKIIINQEIASSVQNMSSMMPIPVYYDNEEKISLEIDKDRFSAVMEHLIRNAQEATDNNGNIDVRLTRQDGMAVIDISDTGHGMDKNFIQNRLFKPFDTTKGNAGMGIGVFEARQFVQQYGGKIKVQSQPGEGTLFTIYLPVDKG